jgi:hypothetical protein
MRPMTIAFLITLATSVWIITSSPHLWFFAMLCTLYAGVGMVQAEVIGNLADRVRKNTLLLEAARLTLNAASRALDAQEKAKEKAQ